MVGEEGFEPPTLWSQTRCATKLRYSPERWVYYSLCLEAQPLWLYFLCKSARLLKSSALQRKLVGCDLIFSP